MAKFGKKNKINLDIASYNVGLIGESGIGKEQPLDALIAVENGWVAMGEIKVGDEIYGEDGKLHNVLGVYPQGLKDIYKVEFSDGTSAECGLEHLWHVQTKKQREASRNNNDYRFMIKQLKDIMSDYDSPKCGYKYSIPVTKPVEYSQKQLPIKPYILGLLLGDGGLTNALTFTNAEDELIKTITDYLDEIGNTYIIRDYENHKQVCISNKDNVTNSLKDKLIELGLYGTGSREKFIPTDYLHSSIEDRVNLLAGFINTDGHVTKNVSLTSSTYSEELSKGLVELSRSLGLNTSYSQYDRTNEDSTDKYEEEIEYKFNVMGDLTLVYDKLSEKHKELLKPRNFGYVKSIVNIEYVGKKEAQCIKVSNPSSLYLTNDFVVTHNTTLMKDVLEKVTGNDGYMILNCGLEDGVDALGNVSYEDIPDFETLIEFVEDVVENKDTDYPDLKVIVVDTSDELFRIAEPYIVYLHNKQNPENKVKSINSAFGGFGKGLDKLVDEVLNTLWKLKREAGVSIWWTGHTKRKSVSDIFTGEEYETLSSNMAQKYFNAIKTKLHFLGVASIDRDIEKIKVKQKVGADKVLGKVKSESRVISFRDDNFNIDSKSRFTEITDRIPLNVDEFIKALQDAIYAEHVKSGGKLDNVKEVIKEREAEKKEKLEEVREVKEDVNFIDESKNKQLLTIIGTYSQSDDSDDEVIASIGALFAETGLKASKVDEIPTSVYKKAVALIEG